MPIENSFLYVVPVYLTAEGTDFPQLKRVIVISGDKVAMEPTLDEAIQAVFGTQQPQTPGQSPGRPQESGQARAAFDKAQKAMEQGNWGDFGKAMDALLREFNRARMPALKKLPTCLKKSGVLRIATPPTPASPRAQASFACSEQRWPF